MTTNKPEVVAYYHTNKEKPEHRGVSLHHDASCTSTLTDTEPLIRLSDYEALAAEYDRLRSYYKNGIDCFANPCENHSGEKTPPFSELFEEYGGLCLICVVDSNKALQAENERVRSDARRYRWIRDGGWLLIGEDRGNGPEWPSAETVDALVDRAIAERLSSFRYT